MTGLDAPLVRALEQECGPASEGAKEHGTMAAQLARLMEENNAEADSFLQNERAFQRRLE